MSRLITGLLAVFALIGSAAGQNVSECSIPALEIPDVTLVTDSIDVVDDVVIREVEITTEITHTFIGDLVMTVTSPTGTVVTLHNGQGDGDDDIDVVWSTSGIDNGAPYDCDCQMKPASNSLASMNMDSSKGLWTLSVEDTASPDPGTLDRWCVDVYGNRTPDQRECSTPALDIVDLATVTDTVEFTESGIVEDVEVLTEISHTFIGDMTIRLESPTGTTVTLFDQEGGDANDINATWSRFGASATSYDCDCLLRPATGSLLAFREEDSIGDWTLEIDDVTSLEVGVLDRWCLEVFTGREVENETCSSPSLSIPDGTQLTDVMNISEDLTILDVQVETEITHSWIGDLIIEVVSPAGTKVMLYEGRGGADSDMDVVFASDGVQHDVVPFDCDCLMRPSGPSFLTDFGGESSLGDWSLEVEDVVAPDPGTLDRWCVQIITAPEPDFEDCILGPEDIPDDGTSLVSGLDVGDEGIIGDAEVLVEITHPFVGDVVLDIESPSGTTVPLYAMSGGDATDMDVIYSSRRGVPHASKLFDCECSMEPVDHLGVLTGEDSAGEWSLIAADLIAEFAGTLDRWCLRLYTMPEATVEECSEPDADFGFPPDQAIDDTIEITSGPIIEEVRTSVDLTHAWIGSLNVSLESPQGTTVDLHRFRGGTETAIDVTYSDRGVANGSQAFDCECHMRPQGPGLMSDYRGEDSTGDWTLHIYDSDVEFYEGNLASWCVAIVEQVEGGRDFLRGDASGNGDLFAILDASYLLEWAFTGGPAPLCDDAADMDDDGTLFAILDALFLLEYAFVGGPPPPDPGPSTCGPDPTDDDLGCDNDTCL